MESLYLTFRFDTLILKFYVQIYNLILKFHLYVLPDFNYLKDLTFFVLPLSLKAICLFICNFDTLLAHSICI